MNAYDLTGMVERMKELRCVMEAVDLEGSADHEDSLDDNGFVGKVYVHRRQDLKGIDKILGFLQEESLERVNALHSYGRTKRSFPIRLPNYRDLNQSLL